MWHRQSKYYGTFSRRPIFRNPKAPCSAGGVLKWMGAANDRLGLEATIIQCPPDQVSDQRRMNNQMDQAQHQRRKHEERDLSDMPTSVPAEEHGGKHRGEKTADKHTKIVANRKVISSKHEIAERVDSRHDHQGSHNLNELSGSRIGSSLSLRGHSFHSFVERRARVPLAAWPPVNQAVRVGNAVELVNRAAGRCCHGTASCSPSVLVAVCKAIMGRIDA
jgi:hypothetical protein